MSSTEDIDSPGVSQWFDKTKPVVDYLRVDRHACSPGREFRQQLRFSVKSSDQGPIPFYQTSTGIKGLAAAYWRNQPALSPCFKNSCRLFVNGPVSLIRTIDKVQQHLPFPAADHVHAGSVFTGKFK